MRTPRRASPLRRLRATGLRGVRRLRTVQDALVVRLGSSAEGRTRLVSAMLERSAHEPTAYWLQLGVSIGIATLGLVVGSAAVIIGAMLVAPLMGPIIALAMGLATGSPYLVLRASGRIGLSVLAATGGAALITVLLPFHELNAEIAARTSPTLLDLLVAGFCALAGVYASLRPGSDTATTAAGTSIGISLVPPLCASGYGIGTEFWPVAAGAALLFLTNLVAIILVGVLAFMAAGFNRVPVTRLEREALAKGELASITAAISRRLSGLFESRAGPALRFTMPIVLLAVVYTPLRQGLDEVAWQVRVRAAVQKAIDGERLNIVQSQVRVERHEVDMQLVLVGEASDAEMTRARLHTKVSAAAGLEPRIEVLAIPDATAFAGLELKLRQARDPRPLPLPATPPAEQLVIGGKFLHDRVLRLWPIDAAGAALGIAVTVGEASDGFRRIQVAHLGEPLGPAALEALERGLSAELDAPILVTASAIPPEPLTRGVGDLTFLSRVSSALQASLAIAAIHVCATVPTPGRGRQKPRDAQLAEALHGVLAQHPRASATDGDDFAVRFVVGACPSGPPENAPETR